MTVRKSDFRVGQEVIVTYHARVAEVGSEHPHREGRIIRLETNAIPTGWIDPSQEGLSVVIVREPLPDKPGMYWQDAVSGQSHMAEWHTDGKEFHYLNTVGKWVDIGFGFPDEDLPLYPLVETPF